jgi:hypothetical protein
MAIIVMNCVCESAYIQPIIQLLCCTVSWETVASGIQNLAVEEASILCRALCSLHRSPEGNFSGLMQATESYYSSTCSETRHLLYHITNVRGCGILIVLNTSTCREQSPKQAVKAYRIVRRRGSHIF